MLGVGGRGGKGDQKAYKYLSNFKMQIPCLWPCWDQIFHYHLSGKSSRGGGWGGKVKHSCSLHGVVWFGLVRFCGQVWIWDKCFHSTQTWKQVAS